MLCFYATPPTSWIGWHTPQVAFPAPRSPHGRSATVVPPPLRRPTRRPAFGVGYVHIRPWGSCVGRATTLAVRRPPATPDVRSLSRLVPSIAFPATLQHLSVVGWVRPLAQQSGPRPWLHPLTHRAALPAMKSATKRGHLCPLLCPTPETARILWPIPSTRMR